MHLQASEEKHLKTIIYGVCKVWYLDEVKRPGDHIRLQQVSDDHVQQVKHVTVALRVMLSTNKWGGIVTFDVKPGGQSSTGSCLKCNLILVDVQMVRDHTAPSAGQVAS